MFCDFVFPVSMIFCFLVPHLQTCRSNDMKLLTPLGFPFWFPAHFFDSVLSVSACNSVLSILVLSVFCVSPNRHNYFAFSSYEWILNSRFSQNFISDCFVIFVSALITHFIFVTCLLLRICEVCIFISQLISHLFRGLYCFPKFFTVNVSIIPQIML